MNNDNKSSLEEEKEKLNKLVEEAFDKGIPFAQNNTILEQSYKVDTLVVKAQKEKKKRVKKQRDR